MTAKAAGICLIVLSSFGLGLIKSVELQKRYRLLKEWEKIVLLLEQEISCHIPLPEAYHRVGDRVCDPFKPFLESLSKQLDAHGGKSFREIFTQEGKRCLAGGCLTGEDLRQICALGDLVGFADRKTQKNLLDRYRKEQEIRLAQLGDQLPAKQKLYRSLGILGGAFLGILLL